MLYYENLSMIPLPLSMMETIHYNISVFITKIL